jgi:hypothetical protein
MDHRISTHAILSGSIAYLLSTSVALAQDEDANWGTAEPSSPAPTYRPPPPPDSAPQSPRNAVVPAQSTAEVRFEPDDPNLRLMTLSAVMPYQELAFVRHGWWRPRRYYFGFGAAPVYVPLCSGPCTLRLMRGPYHFALAKSGGNVLPLAGKQVITGASTLRAEYIDRSAQRTAGYITAIVGGIGGLIMIAESYDSHEVCNGYGYCYTQTDINDALLVGGIAVFVGAAITSSILISQRDEARLTLAPLRVAQSTPRHDAAPRQTGSSLPQGVALSLKF